MKSYYPNLSREIFEIVCGSWTPVTVDNVIVSFNICFFLYLDEIEQNQIPTKYGDMIEQTRKRIEKSENKFLQGAFNILSVYVLDDDVYNKVISKIFSLKDKTNVKMLMEYLIDELFLVKFYKEIHTPNIINELAVKILNPINGSFYDGTAGVGSTVRSAFYYSKKLNGNLIIYTQEMSDLIYGISVVLNYVNDINDIHQEQGDTLVSPKFFENNKITQFDYSIMFPPLGMKNRNEEIQTLIQDRFGRFGKTMLSPVGLDWIFAMHQIASLRDDSGKGVCCIPSGSLFNAVSSEIRAKIIESNIIESIITLPTGALTPFSAASVSLIFFNKGLKAESIIMINAENLKSAENKVGRGRKSIFSELEMQRIVDICVNRTEEDGISRIVPINELNESILLPSKYVSTNEIKTSILNSVKIDKQQADKAIENWETLKNIGMVYRGINIPNYLDESSGEEIKIINYSDINDGQMDAAKLNVYQINIPKKIDRYKISHEDILVSCKGTAIKIYIVPELNEKILISHNFIGIRINKKIYSPLFVKYYLESPIGIYFLKNLQLGSTISFINPKDLETIPVPKIGLKKQIEFTNDLYTKELDIKNRIQELYTQRQNLIWDYYTSIGLTDIIQK